MYSRISMSMASVCSIRFGGNPTPWRSASSVAKTSITASTAVSRETRSRSGPHGVSPSAYAEARASILLSARSFRLIRSATRQEGARSPLSPSVWLGRLAEPETLAGLRHEADHGDNSTPLRSASGQEDSAERWAKRGRWRSKLAELALRPGFRLKARSPSIEPPGAGDDTSLGKQSSSCRASTL
jgi:hypothetical protein